MSFPKTISLIGVCLFVLMLDIVTKAYSFFCVAPMAISSHTYPYGGIGVFQNFLGIDFSINYVMNKGAAWGMLSSYQNYLLLLRILIIAGLIGYLLVTKISFSKRFSLSLVVTGALGNVIDYFAYGHVVDMFYFRFWGYSYPVFNVADSVIFVGIALLFFFSHKEKKNLKIIKK